MPNEWGLFLHCVELWVTSYTGHPRFLIFAAIDAILDSALDIGGAHVENARDLPLLQVTSLLLSWGSCTPVWLWSDFHGERDCAQCQFGKYFEICTYDSILNVGTCEVTLSCSITYSFNHRYLPGWRLCPLNHWWARQPLGHEPSPSRLGQE